MRTLITSAKHGAVAFAAVLFASTSFAESSVWAWNSMRNQGGPYPGCSGFDGAAVLHLSIDGQRINGKVTTPQRLGSMTTLPLVNASVRGDTISFRVERDMNGLRFASLFTGRLTGNTIEGTVVVWDMKNKRPKTLAWHAVRNE